jgi:hypothetical protein
MLLFNFLSNQKEGESFRERIARLLDNASVKLKEYWELLKQLGIFIYDNKPLFIALIVLLVSIVGLLLVSVHKRREEKRMFERAVFSALENLT